VTLPTPTAGQPPTTVQESGGIAAIAAGAAATVVLTPGHDGTAHVGQSSGGRVTVG
jgi:hypothetical protein